MLSRTHGRSVLLFQRLKGAVLGRIDHGMFVESIVLNLLLLMDQRFDRRRRRNSA